MSDDGTRELDPDDLKPHPVNEGLFPADETRDFPIEGEELEENPRVTPESHFTDADWTIISGHRRIEGVKEQGWDTVEVEVVEYDSKQEERGAVLLANVQRNKYAGEQVQFAAELEDYFESVPDLERAPAEEAAERADMSKSTYYKGRRVKQAAEEGTWGNKEKQLSERTQKIAEKEWTDLQYGDQSIGGAHTEIENAIDRQERHRQRTQLKERDDLHITPQEEADRKIDTDPLPEPVRPFVWYGGKANLADWIISRMPEHDTYVEPFAGQAGVLFNKPPSRVEVLNDFDTGVTTFFEVLRDKRELLKGSAVSIPYFDESHDRLADRWFDGEKFEDDVVSAAVFLFLTHAQLYGKMGSKSSFDPTTPTSYYKRVQRLPSLQQRLTRDNPDHFRERFAGEVDEVAVLAEKRLRDINECDEVQIRNEDFETVLREYDSEDTLAYVDPPYYGTEEHYDKKFDEDDHQRLVNVLNDFDGYWILSYGSEPPEDLQTDYTESPIIVTRSPGQEEKGTEGEEWLITNIPEEHIGTFETVREQKPADEW